MIAREEEPPPEQLFAEFKSLVRIHLKQMLKLDRRPPIYAVALLVAVACEQISHLFPAEGSDEEVFSKAIIEPHGISRRVGRDLFDVIRNGFAHSYYPKMLQIDDEMVGVTFAWKKRAGRDHLGVYGLQRIGLHKVAVPVELDDTGYRWLVVVVDKLWRSLDAYLTDVETRVKAQDGSPRSQRTLAKEGPNPRDGCRGMAPLPGQWNSSHQGQGAVMSAWAIYARKSTEQTASGKQRFGGRVRVLGGLFLALLSAGGCTTSSTARSDPDLSPATKPDMKNYVQDSYQCVRESEQEIRLGQLPWSRQRDAQRLYETCMSARGYEVQHR